MPLELIAPAVATLAAVTDWRGRKIPNWLTLGALLAGLLGHTVRDGASGTVLALSGAALGLGLLVPFYAMRTIGAGDVKLLAGLGALVGPHALVNVAIYAALVGGAISVVILARQGTLQFSMAEIMTQPHRLTRSGAKAPYALPIAAGVYLSMLLPSVIG